MVLHSTGTHSISMGCGSYPAFGDPIAHSKCEQIPGWCWYKHFSIQCCTLMMNNKLVISEPHIDVFQAPPESKADKKKVGLGSQVRK